MVKLRTLHEHREGQLLSRGRQAQNQCRGGLEAHPGSVQDDRLRYGWRGRLRSGCRRSTMSRFQDDREHQL